MRVRPCNSAQQPAPARLDGAHLTRRQAARLVTAAALTAVARPAAAWAGAPAAVPRLSCMLWTLNKLATFPRQLEIVAAAGYQGVELVGEPQHWSPVETARNLAQLRSLGLTVDAMSGVHTGFATPGAGAQFLTDLKSQLDAAATLGCPQLILLSGPRVPTLSTADQTKVAADNLHRAADLAAEHSVELLIEPIDPLEDPKVFLQSVTDAFALVRSVGHPKLRVLYDLYHEQRAFGNLTEKLENNLDLVGLIHVADVPGRHEPGTGELNFPNIYRKLAALHYTRWIAMEFLPTADPATSLRAAKQQVVEAFTAAKL